MVDFYQAWRSGKVNRMHTMPQLVRENVAEHTWGVLMMCLRFYPQARKEFLAALILHDAGEIATGDIPAHIKWSTPELEDICHEKESHHVQEMGYDYPLLTDAENKLMLVFDKLDFCVSCIHEMRMGNLNAARYFNRSLSKADETYVGMQASESEVKKVAANAIREVVALKHKYLQHIPEQEYDLNRQ
jgi:5'-deoxynucleotidase YfbR-like HD superfamily hydrolase